MSRVRARQAIRPAVGQALVLALLGVAASAASAAPPFGDPVDVAPGDTQAGVPSAAFDAAANLEIGWTTGAETPRLATARRAIGGGFGAGPAIATGDAVEGPVLAAGPDGQLVAAWTAADPDSGTPRVFASWVGAGGEPLGAVPVSVAGEEASEPAIVVGGDGRVAIAWAVADDELSQVKAVHGGLGASLTAGVVSAGDATAIEPEVAFDAAGILQVAFTAVGGESTRVKVAGEIAPGTFAASRAVSGAVAAASAPAIVAAPGGGLAIAWTQAVGALGTAVRVGIEASPGATVTTSLVSGGGDSRGARLAVDPAAGTLDIAWIRALANTESALVAPITGGVVGTPQVVSDADAAVSDLDFAYSSLADGVVTWRRDLAPGAEEPMADIRAAVFDTPRPPVTPPPPPPIDPPPPPIVPPPPLPSAPITLTGLTVDPACIRYGAPFTGPRRRLSFGFTLSEPATVRISIQRRLNSGAQRVCPPVRVRGAIGRLGTPVVVELPAGAGLGTAALGDEGEAIAAGASLRPPRSATLTRRMAAGRRRFVVRQSPTALAPGTYIATATATTADGRRSTAPLVKFWVLLGARAR